jgi:hypothetical protein
MKLQHLMELVISFESNWNTFTFLNSKLLFKSLVHYVFRPIWSSTSSSSSGASKFLLHFPQWIQFQSVPSFMRPRVPCCTLIGMLCDDSSDVICRCCDLVVCFERRATMLWTKLISWKHRPSKKKSSSLYDMYRDITHNWTPLCKNCLCTAVSQNSTLRPHTRT